MNSLKLISVSICLLFSINVLSQEIKTSEAYYNYELIPNGRIHNGIDTSYTVILIMDTVDVKRYSSVIIGDDQRTSEFSFNSGDSEELSRRTLSMEKIRMDMSDWLSSESWEVTALRSDGTKVLLKLRPLKDDIIPIVEPINPKTRNLTFSTEKPVVETAVQNR